MDVLVIVIQSVAVVLSFLFIIYMVHQKQSLLCTYLLIYSAAVFLNNIGYLMETQSNTLEQALIIIRFEYIGMGTAVVAALFFICELFQARIATWVRGLYIFFFCATFLLVVTNEYHHLHYSECSLELRKYFAVFHMEVGPNYIWHTILMLTSLVGCITVIVKAWAKDAKRKENFKKYLVLGLAAAIPVFFWIMHFVGPIRDYDMIPIGLFCTNACFILIIYHFRIFNVAESAKNEVLETMEAGILVSDNEGNIVYTNAAARNLFEEKEPKKLVEVEKILQPAEDGNCYIGGRYYSVNESEVYEENQVTGKTYSFIDVTRRKEREQQLKELRDEAMAANNAKSIFLANMSHEIRTPLNTILGMGEMILRESEDEQISEYAENIKREGKALMSLISDVLDFSKIESGRMELAEREYSFISLMQNVISLFSAKAEEKGLEFKVAVSDRIPKVLLGDELRIKQIISNILNNAIKYTEKGSVLFCVECGEVINGKTMLKVSVKDTGIGIRKEELKLIFEAFRRLDRERTARIEGTGLGMNITLRLLELMNGKIDVDSEYGKGSEFVVQIPQKVANSAPVGSQSYPVQKKEKKEKKVLFTAPDAKILVVDDNTMNRVVVKGLLKRTLVQLEEASGGQECLRLTEKTHYDIILLDHMMPGMDGVETLHRLKVQDGACKDTVVIVLTANAVAGVKEVYLSEGFDDYLSKPVSGSLLEETLLRYLPKELVKKNGKQNEKQTEKQQPKELKEEQPLISFERGVELFAGDEDLYRETLQLYVDMWEERKDTLKMLLEEDNSKDYAILVHAIKGDVRTLGGEALAEVAYRQELQAKAGELHKVREEFSQLIALGDETAAYICAELQKEREVPND